MAAKTITDSTFRSKSESKIYAEKELLSTNEISEKRSSRDAVSRKRVLLNAGQFNVWRRSFSNKVLSHFEDREKEEFIRRNEWSADDAFNATLLKVNETSMAKLRNCYFSDRQTQILGTLVPDEIINKEDPTKKEMSNFVGVLLFADVSGFTALCEKYSNTGKGGTYRLTATLNGYIGAMVEVIYSHGGDVLKFSGDAFLAIWKVNRDTFMYNTIHKALACALHIQQTLGSFETDVKVFLKVKLAISAGNLTFSVIGDDLNRHYLCAGSPIQEVKAAEHTCVSGDVVLSPSAWGFCSSTNYEYTYKDDYNVKVTRILYDPGVKKRQIVASSRLGNNTPAAFPDEKNIKEQVKTEIRKLSQRRESQEETEKRLNEEASAAPKPGFQRRCVAETVRKNLGLILRPFMIPPVVQQVDADQPLEFLTEMRQVTTMFVNLLPHKMSTHKIIHMVDEAYCTACKLVRSYTGCVNKVSLFDKDVMILCIFGLRGFKNELESQSGLKCAYKVRQAISDLDGVQCVSIGVTTGMTYCGVVGHPLRREYTVIGGTVNKAARIMCAYPGKVTCEQNTFLLSKLPTGNFILQEPKELKGIGTVGPIYEYTKVKAQSAGIQPILPILGRTKEITAFCSIIDELREPQREHSGLLIQGEPRVGKSRLLEELVTEAKLKDCMTVLVTLDTFHATTPYSVVYLVMKQVLGLDESSTVREREKRLFEAIGKDVGTEWLCYLNDIMQVKFPHSTGYLTDNSLTRRWITLKLFQELIRKTTDKLIICLDDAQYIDTESWLILADIIDDDKTLLIMTMYSGHQTITPIATNYLLADDRIIKMKLSGIAELFMAPLACQILHVRAIPLEVEELLQARSKGNPGWCESFLYSLIQSGGLQKVSDVDPVRRASLVVPNINLLDKTSNPELEVTDLEVTNEDELEKQGLHFDQNRPACIIASNFNINDKVIPQNLDAIIMQAFDCLPPYEQLLLKCGSVLGETFSREMLTAVMHNPTPKQTAFAVRRFFDMKILGCGTEDNTSKKRFSNFVMPLQKSTVAELDQKINCNCSRKCEDVFDGWEEVPYYAFCKFLRFTIPTFRDTTYELLPGNQRKEFHARAAEFLEGEAHRCAACGGGEFVRLPSQLLQSFSSLRNGTVSVMIGSSDSSVGSGQSSRNLSRHRPGKLLGKWSAMPFEPMATANENTNKEEEPKPELIAIQPFEPPILLKEERKEEEFTTKVVDLLKHVPRTWKRKESKTVKKGSFLSIGRGFSEVDFRNCECPLILSSVYRQLIEHCEAAGLVDKHVRFLIEYGAASIALGNSIQAIKLLEEAEETSTTTTANESDLSQKVVRLNLGKIHTLIGQAHLDLGQLPEAKEHLLLGLQHYRKPFVSARLLTIVQLAYQQTWQYVYRKFPNTFTGNVSANKAMLLEEVSTSLAHLSNLYMVEQEWSLAKLAAIRSLNLAQKSSNSLSDLCAAYSNMMDVCHHFGELDYCRKLEEFALKTCRDNYEINEVKELLALGRLYCATFISRLHRGELSSAVKIGFRTLQISSRVYANNVKLFVLPLLIQALMMNGRISEAVDLLRELEFSANEDLDNSSSAWFHALCLDLLLDCGVTLVHIDNSLKYSQLIVDSNLLVTDPDVGKRLVVSTWLWYIRKKQWNEAIEWEKRAVQYQDDTLDTSFSSLITSLKLLECMLLTAVTKIGKAGGVYQFTQYLNKVMQFLKRLEKQSRVNKVILPRFLHLQAYACLIQKHRTQAKKLLSQAKLISVIQENTLDESWVEHTKAHWNGTLNNIDLDFWHNHSNESDNIDWHELILRNWSSMMYTLPFDIE